jgi:urease alpha subunit
LNPFNEIEVGHLRRNIGDRDSYFLPPADERRPFDTLLRGYTTHGAYQVGIEDKVSSIEVGKLADLMVIEKDLFRRKPEGIHKNLVLLTGMDGNIVYDNLNGKRSMKGKPGFADAGPAMNSESVCRQFSGFQASSFNSQSAGRLFDSRQGHQAKTSRYG